MNRFLLITIMLIFFIGINSCKSTDNKKECSEQNFTTQDYVSPKQTKQEKVPKKDIEELKYEIILSGSYTNYESYAECKVVRSEKEFLYMLGILGFSQAPKKIDFDKQAVIFAFAGSFNTGGYGINVLHAKKYGKNAEIIFKISRPEPGAIVTQAFTQPYIIVAVKADKEMNMKAGFIPEDNERIIKDFRDL